MANSNGEHLQRQLYLLLIIFGSAALGLALYHIVKVIWYDRRYHAAGPFRRPNFLSFHENTLESMENSVADLIPAHKFIKGVGLVKEDGDCAVCLCDFVEGEELRTLPECLHSFHVQCIDMWFYSHSTCPICRTDAISSVNLAHFLSEDGPRSPVPVSEPRDLPQLIIPIDRV